MYLELWRCVHWKALAAWNLPLRDVQLLAFFVDLTGRCPKLFHKTVIVLNISDRS